VESYAGRESIIRVTAVYSRTRCGALVYSDREGGNVHRGEIVHDTASGKRQRPWRRDCAEHVLGETYRFCSSLTADGLTCLCRTRGENRTAGESRPISALHNPVYYPYTGCGDMPSGKKQLNKLGDSSCTLSDVFFIVAMSTEPRPNFVAS
jgi:hypothetical protein